VVLAWPWHAAPALAAGPASAPLDVATSRTFALDVVAHGARAEVERARDASAQAPADAAAPERANDAGLSPGEIRRRIERYRSWLDDQGLMRLDSVEDEPSYMKEP
jgi:hypothetical protein